MKTMATIARILLALTFLVFRLNGFFQFIKLPPSGVALQFLGALVVSHEIAVIMGLQVLAGALLLVNRFVPLALFVIAPIVLNILLFHFFMDLSPRTPGSPIGSDLLSPFCSKNSDLLQDAIRIAKVACR